MRRGLSKFPRNPHFYESIDPRQRQPLVRVSDLGAQIALFKGILTFKKIKHLEKVRRTQRRGTQPPYKRVICGTT